MYDFLPIQTNFPSSVTVWNDETDELEGDFTAADIVALIAERDALRAALERITRLGGNLSDRVIEDIGGINDGRSRALMYSGARQIARRALADTAGTVKEVQGEG